MVDDHSPPPVPQNCPEALLLDPTVERSSRSFVGFSSSRRRLMTIIGLFVLLAMVGSISMNHSKETKTPDIRQEEFKGWQKQSIKRRYNDILKEYHDNVRLPIQRLALALEPLINGENITEEERREAEGGCGIFKPFKIANILNEMEKVCTVRHLNKDVFDFLHRRNTSIITSSENSPERELYTLLYFILDAQGSKEQLSFQRFWAKHSQSANLTEFFEYFYRRVKFGEKEEVKTQCLPLAIYVANGFKGKLVVQFLDEVSDHIKELRRLTEICSKTEANRGRYEYIYKMKVIWELASVDLFIKNYTQSLLHETWPEIETLFARAIIREKSVERDNWDNASLTELAGEVYRGLSGIGHPDYDHQVAIFPSFRPVQSVEESPESPTFYCKPGYCSIGQEKGLTILLIRQQPLDEAKRRHLNNFADQVDQVFRTAYEKEDYRLDVPLPQMEKTHRVRFSEYERHSAVLFLYDDGWLKINDTAFGVAGEMKDPPAYRTVGFENRAFFSFKVHWSFLIF